MGYQDDFADSIRRREVIAYADALDRIKRHQFFQGNKDVRNFPPEPGSDLDLAMQERQRKGEKALAALDGVESFTGTCAGPTWRADGYAAVRASAATPAPPCEMPSLKNVLVQIGDELAHQRAIVIDGKLYEAELEIVGSYYVLKFKVRT